MLEPKITKTLINYYNNQNIKIILIDSVRQIGKSFIIRNTTSNYFTNYVEIDLKSNYEGERLFEKAKITKAFYLLISSLYVIN